MIRMFLVLILFFFVSCDYSQDKTENNYVQENVCTEEVFMGTKTVLDFPTVTDLQSSDYIYIVRGVGTDRDKKIAGSVLQSYIGDTLLEVTSTGGIDLSTYTTNLTVKYNPTGAISSTITNALPDAKRVLLWNVSAFTVSVSIEGDSFDLVQNEAMEYMSDGSNMKRFDVLIVDKLRAFGDDNTYIDLNADEIEFWTGGVTHLDLGNTGMDYITTAATGLGISFENADTVAGGLSIGIDASEVAFINQKENKDLVIETNDVERLRISSNGKLSTNQAAGTVEQGGIDIETPSSSGTAINVNNGTNDVFTVDNDGDLHVYGGMSTNQGQPVLLEKVVDIGDWNMDTTAFVFVSHGLSANQKIRNVSGLIRTDSGSAPNVYSIPYSSSTDYTTHLVVGTIDSADITLVRKEGSIFDGTDFNSTSYNRGWIYIKYEK